MLMLLLSLLAHADVRPPPDFVETCTVQAHASDTQECTICRAYFGGRVPCEELEAQGYQPACRTSGASVWREVMCRAKTDAAANGVESADGARSADTPQATPADAPPAAPEVAAAAAQEERWCSAVGPAGLIGLPLVLPLVLRRRRS